MQYFNNSVESLWKMELGAAKNKGMIEIIKKHVQEQ